MFALRASSDSWSVLGLVQRNRVLLLTHPELLDLNSGL
jgi:hypothetical protein